MILISSYSGIYLCVSVSCIAHFLAKFQKEDSHDVTIGFVIFLVITGTLMLICCLYCRHKRRKAAKRRHFSRLVNDLNASEKFTLVTPSDEESD